MGIFGTRRARWTILGAITRQPEPLHRAASLLFGRLVPIFVFGFVGLSKAAVLTGDVLGLLAGRPPFLLLTPAHVLSTLFYALLTVSYALRYPRLGGQRTPVVVFVTMFGSFSLMFTGLFPFGQQSPSMLLLAIALIIAGTAYAVWALSQLGRSFSLLPESRRLVTTGPYAFVRHPLYEGEAIASVGALLIVANWWVLPLALLNIPAQLLRIRWEERVLAAEFPEYRDYAARVPRFIPRLRRRRIHDSTLKVAKLG